MAFRTAPIMVCLLACSAFASGGPPMADRLPRDTLAYFGWAGKTDAMSKSTFGKLLQDPAAEAVLKRVRALVAQGLVGRKLKAFQRGWAIGQIVLKHPVAVALADLRLAPDQPPRFLACALVDLGKDRAEFAMALEALLALGGDDLKVQESVSAGGTKYRLVTVPGAPPTALGYRGNTFFACMGGSPEPLLRVTAVKSLAANPKFRSGLKAVGGQNVQAVLYADVAEINARLNPTPRPGAKVQVGPGPIFLEIPAAMGLDRIESVTAALCATDDGWMRTRTRIASPRPHRGQLAAHAGRKLTDADLAGIPAGASGFLAVTFSPQEILEEIRRVRRVMELDLAGAEGKADPGPQLLGVKVIEELLPVLGGSAAFLYAPDPPAGVFLEDSVLTVRLKDPEAFGKLLRRMEAHFERRTPAPDGRPRVRKMPAGRGEIRFVVLADRPVPQKLAWAVRGGRFYLATRPEALQAVIRLAETRPITADAAYQSVRKRLTVAPAGVIYGNTGHLVRTVIPILLRADAPFQEDSKVLMAHLLKLAGYFPPALTGTWADREGITLETWSSAPFGLTVAPLSAALLPILGQARHHARVATSRVNLKCIGMAVMLCRGDENDRFPPDMAALIRKDYMTEGVLHSPLNPRHPPKFVGGRLVGEPHYVYVKGHTGASAKDLILAYETPQAFQGRGTLVLLVNGTVRWMAKDEFGKAMAKTRKALGKKE